MGARRRTFSSTHSTTNRCRTQRIFFRSTSTNTKRDETQRDPTKRAKKLATKQGRRQIPPAHSFPPAVSHRRLLGARWAGGSTREWRNEEADARAQLRRRQKAAKRRQQWRRNKKERTPVFCLFRFPLSRFRKQDRPSPDGRHTHFSGPRAPPARGRPPR